MLGGGLDEIRRVNRYGEACVKLARGQNFCFCAARKLKRLTYSRKFREHSLFSSQAIKQETPKGDS